MSSLRSRSPSPDRYAADSAGAVTTGVKRLREARNMTAIAAQREAAKRAHTQDYAAGGAPTITTTPDTTNTAHGHAPATRTTPATTAVDTRTLDLHDSPQQNAAKKRKVQVEPDKASG
jgi:hypothetical protein